MNNQTDVYKKKVHEAYLKTDIGDVKGFLRRLSEIKEPKKAIRNKKLEKS